jgi:MFS family permease
MRERVVMRFAMWGTAFVFLLYPLVQTPWQMGVLAVLLGVTLGGTQPMVMVMLHHVTPDGRHGESIAFRSIAINMSSTAMPLIFGLAGVAIGVGPLFWIVGGAVGAGSWLTRKLRVPEKSSA